MCLRVREIVAKLLQPHCSANIHSNSHYYCVATVILSFSVFAVNVIGHFSRNNLLIFISELLQFGICIAVLILFICVHIYVGRTSVGAAAASSYHKRRRLVHAAFAVVEITLLIRAILWINIAIALNDADQVPSPHFSFHANAFPSIITHLPQTCALWRVVDSPWAIPLVLFVGETGSSLFCM